MGQVAALVQTHAQHCVPMLAQGLVYGEVGLGAGVGLNIGVVGTEKLLGPLDGDVFHHVHALTAAVVTLARVARGNQLNVLLLAVVLSADGLSHLGIGGGNEVHDFVDHGKHSFFS